MKFDAAAPAPNYASEWSKPPTRPMLAALRSGRQAHSAVMRWWPTPALGQGRKAVLFQLQRAAGRVHPSPHCVTHGSADSGPWP